MDKLHLWFFVLNCSGDQGASVLNKGVDKMELNKEKYDFNDFVEVIRILRSPEGCKWDMSQTHESLKSSLIEEAYELLNEIKTNNTEGMKEELGDVLLQVIMHSQIAKDEGKFDINDVIDAITKKMIFRHPHVFGDTKVSNLDEAYDAFYKSKEIEKQYTGLSDELSRIPKAFPALMKSYKVVKKLHKVQPEIFGSSSEEHFDRVKGEIEEFKEAYLENDKTKMEEELGDILTMTVVLGQVAGIDSEIALNNNCDKIKYKIEDIEKQLKEQNKKIEQISVKEFNEVWEKAKILEK